MSSTQVRYSQADI